MYYQRYYRMTDLNVVAVSVIPTLCCIVDSVVLDVIGFRVLPKMQCRPI